jgi:hypothetical protein
MATRPPKRGEFWRILFEKKGNFGQKFEVVSPFGDFSSKTKRLVGSGQLSSFFIGEISPEREIENKTLKNGVFF